MLSPAPDSDEVIYQTIKRLGVLMLERTFTTNLLDGFNDFDVVLTLHTDCCDTRRRLRFAVIGFGWYVFKV